MSERELLPCPWCAGTPTLLDPVESVQRDIYCTTCRVAVVWNQHEKSDVPRLWNTRPASPVVSAPDPGAEFVRALRDCERALSTISMGTLNTQALAAETLRQIAPVLASLDHARASLSGSGKDNNGT